MLHQRGHIGLPAVETHAPGEAQLGGLVLGQVVGLLIGPGLQTILGAAQKDVSVPECVDRWFRQPVAGGQIVQHRPDAAPAQFGLAPAVDQLEGLADEFDLADAARTELDVALQALAFDLAGDQRLHPAQRLEGAVIQIAPVDERVQHLEQAFARGMVAGYHPGLDQGVALPLAAMGLVVIFQGAERGDQRAGIAERTQPHVDPVDEPLRGDFGQQLDQPLPEAAEEVLVVQAALTVGLSFGRIGEDQVDVGGEVQLAAAQLAHAQHHQPLGLSGRIARRAVAPAQRLERLLQRGIDQGFGQSAEFGQDLVQRRIQGQIAPGDAHHGLAPEAAQRGHQCGFVAAFVQPGGESVPVIAERQRAVQFAVPVEFDQQRRFAAQCLGDELAAGQHPGQLFQSFGRFGQRCTVAFGRFPQGIPMVLGLAAQRFGQGF